MGHVDLPIVVVGFNKVEPLSRLLRSLNDAHYTDEVKLIISIDGEGDPDVHRVANEFEWRYGEKEVVSHSENMGLRRHILHCGGLSQKYDGIIVLEDDLFVSPWFYQYAVRILSEYGKDGNICGVALYSPNYNEASFLPFQPLNDGADCFFMQLPCSWGQIWSKGQWNDFIKWYKDNKNIDISKDKTIPHNIRRWPKTSWKKYFTKYMVERDKYFVYPQSSFTTNYGDKGQHHTGTYLFQVPLALEKENFVLNSFSESKLKYDVFCELHADTIKIYNKSLESYDICVDLHGAKEFDCLSSGYVLTSKKTIKAEKKFGRELVPIENNLFYDILGNDIFLSKIEDVEPIDDINIYMYLKANEASEHFYYYSLDTIHFSVMKGRERLRVKEVEGIRENIRKISLEREELKAKCADLADMRQQMSVITNSYSFKIGKTLVTPFSTMKRLVLNILG